LKPPADAPATEAPRAVARLPESAAKDAPREAKPAETAKEAKANDVKPAEPAKDSKDAKAKDAKTVDAAHKADAKGKDAKDATKAGTKFVVQIAALGDAAKAKQLLQQVNGTGVKAYTETVKTAKGDVTRVRAGPYDSREAAEKARGKLKGAGLDGKVVPR